MADGIEMFTPYSSFTVTAARAENLISAWAYSIFGTGITIRRTTLLGFAEEMTFFIARCT